MTIALKTIVTISIVVLLQRQIQAQTCTSGECDVGDESAEDSFVPTVIIHEPQAGAVVEGYVKIAWEVLFFDIAEGFVIMEVDGETVETPLPFDPVSSSLFEPEMYLESRFGSGVPLTDGPHTIEAVLYWLNGEKVTSTAVNFTVTLSPRAKGPDYAASGIAQSMQTFLEMSVRQNRGISDVFSDWITQWPIEGHCGMMEPVPGFQDPEDYSSRPLVVYACPPDVCGGTLSWLSWSEAGVAACGERCLWVQRMACFHHADVVLLSCYADPPPGFAKWPHQVWAYFCMESDTRRNMLSTHILPLIDLFANYRLHGDIPRTLSGPAPPPHVTVTYTPGNPAMYLLASSAAREHLAAYLVSNCGRPRSPSPPPPPRRPLTSPSTAQSVAAPASLAALGPDLLHSYGRCFNNRQFPSDKEHGSNTLALLRSYKFTIAIENYLSHDYVSERFYQPLLAGSVPVYLGAPNIHEFAPGPHSFISIRDFPSAEALAAHLLSLAHDDAEYNKLHAWRAGGLAPSFETLMAQSMTRGAVYGEGKHHGCQHQIDLTHLHTAMCRRVQQVPSRSDVTCDW